MALFGPVACHTSFGCANGRVPITAYGSFDDQSTALDELLLLELLLNAAAEVLVANRNGVRAFRVPLLCWLVTPASVFNPATASAMIGAVTPCASNAALARHVNLMTSFRILNTPYLETFPGPCKDLHVVMMHPFLAEHNRFAEYLVVFNKNQITISADHHETGTKHSTAPSRLPNELLDLLLLRPTSKDDCPRRDKQSPNDCQNSAILVPRFRKSPLLLRR